jgi:hypothetical protein
VIKHETMRVGEMNDSRSATIRLADLQVTTTLYLICVKG